MLSAPWHPAARRAVCVAAIFALTLAAYLPVLSAGFIWDDDDWVLREEVRDPAGLREIWFEPGTTQQYYPLLFTMFWVEFRLWGPGHPAGYHLVNVLLHALNGVLLWLALERLRFPSGRTRSWMPAFVGGLVFALHPVHVESVAWITEGKNTLSTACYLGSLLAYLRFCEPDEDRPLAERKWVWYGLALALFLGAALSKTAAVTLPAAILVIVWWKRKSLLREVGPLIPMFAIATGAALITIWMEKTRVGAAGADWSLSILERCLLAGRIPWFYAGKLLAPFGLVFIYPRWEIDAGAASQYLYPFAGLALIGVLWVYRVRIGRGPLAAVLLFGGTLVPALGFFDVYAFRFSWVADHFQYLASASLIALFVGAADYGLRRLGGERKIVAIGLACAVLTCLGWLTWKQTHIYRDYETLWRETLARNPQAWIAHSNLGLVYGERGETERALAAFREAARIKPEDAVVRMNVGRALSMSDRFDEADSEFARAIELGRDLPLVHFNYAAHLLRSDRAEAAVEHYERALELNPDAGWHATLGHLLARLGRAERALQHYRSALELDPRNHEAEFGAARALQVKGRDAEAAEHYRRAIELSPDLFQAHYNLGVIAGGARQWPEAAEHFVRATQLRPDHAAARFNLARMLVLLGREDEAVEEMTRALELARAAGQSELAASIAAGLERYQARQPGAGEQPD